ncbi:putative 3-phosphoshikimate 1-carboxyvinyltransferase [Helianthus anomalus]
MIVGKKVSKVIGSSKEISPPFFSDVARMHKGEDILEHLKGFLTHDVAMTLAVVALYADGPTAIRDVMPILGADVHCFLGTNCSPVRVVGGGGLPGGKVKMSGSVSSQYLTALLMASPLALGDVEIEIIDKLIYIPHVDMTIKLMERFGVSVKHSDSWTGSSSKAVKVTRHPETCKSKVTLRVRVTSWRVPTITGGTITVEGCETSSLQGDVKFAEVLGQLGAEVTWTENSVTVRGPPRDASGRKHLRDVDVNMNKILMLP